MVCEHRHGVFPSLFPSFFLLLCSFVTSLLDAEFLLLFVSVFTQGLLGRWVDDG